MNIRSARRRSVLSPKLLIYYINGAKHLDQGGLGSTRYSMQAGTSRAPLTPRPRAHVTCYMMWRVVCGRDRDVRGGGAPGTHHEKHLDAGQRHEDTRGVLGTVVHLCELILYSSHTSYINC